MKLVAISYNGKMVTSLSAHDYSQIIAMEPSKNLFVLIPLITSKAKGLEHVKHTIKNIHVN
jgi:hypothetical protein